MILVYNKLENAKSSIGTESGSTVSNLVLSLGGKITNRHKEIYKGVGSVCYLDWSDGFHRYIHITKFIKLYFKYVRLVYVNYTSKVVIAHKSVCILYTYISLY